ncbi:MAG: hypothetical protein ABI461_19690, partial [Polyangiaceae bacterium]
MVIRASARKKQLVAGLLAGGVAAFSSASASAQTIALNAQSVVLHFNQDGSASAHPNGSQPTWISHSDCEANVYLGVPLTLTPAASGGLTYPVQIWAGNSGADCTDPTQRVGTTSQCWQVSAPLTPATAITAKINAQDIVSQITVPSGQKPTNFTPGTTAACDTFSQSGPVAVTLFFFFTNAGGAVIGTPATYGLSVALIGPAAPSAIVVGAGDTLLKLNWTPASDSNTQGFQVFCDP